jgi:phage shock protein C
MRSRTDRVLGGVAGGIGQHLGIDPIIIRLVFVVLVLAGGSGLLAYLIAWVVIPAAPAGAEEEAPAPAGRSSDPDSTARIAGLGLIALGALLLAERLLPAFSWRLVAPLLLIALGILLLLRRGASR